MTEFNREELEKLLSDDLIIKIKALGDIDAMGDTNPLKKPFLACIEGCLYEDTLNIARALRAILMVFGSLDEKDVYGNAADTL